MNMRWQTAWCACWLAVTLALATGGGQAQAGTDAKSAEEHFAAGLTLQKQSEKAESPAAVVRGYEQAIAQFRSATQLRPEFYQAHARWSFCLLGLALSTAEPLQRWQYVQAACERFAIASRCPDGDWQICRDWADMLGSRVDRLAVDATQRRAVLTEAQKACSAGLPLTRFAAQRAVLKYYDAHISEMLAEASTEPAEKRALYERAVAGFQTAVAERTTETPPAIHNQWAVCLMQLGKLTDNRQLLRQAVTRYQTALELDPQNANTHYNLGCAYTLLGQPEEAIRSLRRSLELDGRESNRNAIQQDPDLSTLRSRRDFHALLEEKTANMNSDKFFFSGLDWQHEAEEAKNSQEALTKYEQAVAQYLQAVAAQPDHTRAQLMLAICLVGQAGCTADATQRDLLLRTAREHLAVASGDSKINATAFQFWGTCLANNASSLATNNTQRRAILNEARTAFESSRKLSRSSSDGARTDARLGWCLAQLASVSVEIAGAQPLYQQAISRFEAAHQTNANALAPKEHQAWGFALFQLAKLTRNRQLMHQAVERLQVVAEKDPKDAETHYDLACCYAWLNQPAIALRQLGLCVANDVEEKYCAIAATDPDLKSLRERAEFREICRAGQCLLIPPRVQYR